MKKGVVLSVCMLVCVLLLATPSCTKEIGALPKAEVPVDTSKTTTVDPCDTITYTKHIKPIVDKVCLGCHGDNKPSAGFSLNSYTAMKDKGQTGKITARVINGNPLPAMPKGRAQFPADTLAMFKCWIQNGYKQ